LIFFISAKKLPKSDSGGQTGQRGANQGVRLNEQNQSEGSGCCK